MPKKNGRKHLTKGDRRTIEEGLKQSESMSKIARRIGVPPSTVSREIKRNAADKGYAYAAKPNNHCKHYRGCDIRNLCRTNCAKRCASCKITRCSKVCGKYIEKGCPHLESTPFCCNGCAMKKHCGYRRFFYSATKAHELADARLRQSRQGVSACPEDLERMVEVVKKGLKNDQAFYHIWRAHPEFPVTARTFYYYQEKGIVDIKAIEMPAKVRYRQRRGKGVKDSRPIAFDPAGRTYDDFKALDEKLQASRVEMDCVEGRACDTQVILTLHFVRLEFQLMILLKEKTQEEVHRALDWLEECLGDRFMRYIPLILTDRGSEFKDFKSIGRSRIKGLRTNVYYCDPGHSEQKGACENNHREIRKILPKGKTDFDLLDAYKVAIVASHVNSYIREHLGGLAPHTLASQMLPKPLFEQMGITFIEPDDVNMSPRLIDGDS